MLGQCLVARSNAYYAIKALEAWRCARAMNAIDHGLWATEMALDAANKLIQARETIPVAKDVPEEGSCIGEFTTCCVQVIAVLICDP